MRLGDPLSAWSRAEPWGAGEGGSDGGPSGEGHRKRARLWRSSWAEWPLSGGLVPECVLGAGAQEKRPNHGPPG